MKSTRVRTPHEILADTEGAKIIPDDAVLNAREAADFLTRLGRPFTENSLAVYRVVKPDVVRFQRRGRNVRYIAGDLRAFALGNNA